MTYEEFKNSQEIELLLSYEGEAVDDDPRDPGGLTKYGICIRAYPQLGREGIKSLTREQAKEIYYRDYYEKNGCSLLPRPMAFLLFDSCVNQGPGFAVKAMQKALGFPDKDCDGIIGIETIKRTKQKGLKGLQEFALARQIRYVMDSKGFRENFKVFGNGWTRRLFGVFSVCVSLWHDEEGR